MATAGGESDLSHSESSWSETNWSGAARSVWGKTSPDAMSSDHGMSLPLIEHLEDTRGVALHLWDRWLPPLVKRRVTQALNGSEQNARALLGWLAAVHDVAKATPAFAHKARAVGMDHLLDIMASTGLKCPPVTRDDVIHHGVMGQIAVDEWLKERVGMSPSAAASIAVVVGGHHGLPPDTGPLSDVRNRQDPRRGSRAWGDKSWGAVRTEILDVMAGRTGVRPALECIAAQALPLTVQVDLTAAVIVADWIASDEANFPYDVVSGPDRLADALSRLDLPAPWHPGLIDYSDVSSVLGGRVPHLAGRPAHAIQREVIAACLEADGAPLVVVEAPMGNGKTEAGLMAAEILAARFGAGGLFVALPTMATSDAMFERVLGWLRRLPGHGTTSVYLAHSKAGLNDAFRGLAAQGRFRSVYDDESTRSEESSERLAPRVSAWLQGRKRGVLANHVIGTIDQVLLAGLKSRHLALRHLAVSGKVVVIDEVHAADDYMRGYLCTVLRWLGAYGTPVVLMSATLPSAQRAELVSAYAKGRNGRRFEVEVPGPTSYPAITEVGSQITSRAVTEAPTNREVAVEALDDAEDALVDVLRGNLQDGGCAVVIRNTVGRAQSIYQRLRQEFGTDEVALVHSRFIAPDRLRLEADLRRHLGPPLDRDGNRPKRLVVVGTQVLEQSLDIDADLMVSDIAPMDLVLQRMGRLHRHERPVGARPPRVRTPKLFLTGVRDWPASATPPTFERGSLAVYGSHRLLRAMAVLRPHLAGAPILLPVDIPRLVEAAYDDNDAPPEGWDNTWSDALAKHVKTIESR